MNGLAAERRVARTLADLGYLVSSRRHFEGAGDLLAISDRWWHGGALIEVKATAREPWNASGFGPDQRHDLRLTAEAYELEPLLAWMIRPGHICWLTKEDWPSC